MLYSDILTYDQPHFRYDGVSVVSPSSISSINSFGGLKVRAVFVIRPISIDSTIVFVAANKVIINLDSELVTTTSGTISFLDPDPEGYIAFNVLNEEASIIMQAETIYVSPSAEAEYSSSQSIQATLESGTITTQPSVESQFDITIV